MGTNFLLCAVILALAASGCASQQSTTERKADVYHDAGVGALARNSYSEALQNLLEAVKLSPKDPAVWSDLGIAYAGKEDLAKAEECWRKALQLNKAYSDARFNLAMLYARHRRYPEATRLFKEVSKDLTYGRRADVAFEFGRLYLTQAQPRLAEEQFLQATKENEAHCAAWTQLARLQKKRGDLAQASESLRHGVMGFCSNNPESHYELGSLLLQLQKTSEAKRKFLEVIQLFPASEWASRSEEALNQIR